jgi:putative SOS response-associated peptidase YedK
MCGRACCVLADRDIVAAVAGPGPSSEAAAELAWPESNRAAYTPLRNAGPSMVLPCVTDIAATPPSPAGGDSGAPTSAAATTTLIPVESMAWGFPRVAAPRSPTSPSHPHPHSHQLLINARAETALTTPTWARALAQAAGRGRAVLVVNGYYEWKRPRTMGSAAPSVPHYVHRADGLPLALAACVCGGGGGGGGGGGVEAAAASPRRFAVVTTDPPPALAWLHDRVPLLLPTPGAVRAWLHPPGGRLSAAGLAALAGPAAVQASWPELAAHPVTRAMGSVKYQAVDCNMDTRQAKGSIHSLFTAAKAAKAAEAASGGGKKRAAQEGGGGPPPPPPSASPPLPHKVKKEGGVTTSPRGRGQAKLDAFFKQ